MAAIKFIKRTVALDGNSISEQLPASFFNSEASAHTFIIAAMRGGQPLTLSGAVSATFLNANDAVVLVTGSIVDGAAVVTLSNDCYALSGRFTLTIDVNGATVYECQSRIKRRSSGTAYDPSGEISVASLSAEIAAMRTATAAANTAAAAANNVNIDLTPGTDEATVTITRADGTQKSQTLRTVGIDDYNVMRAEINTRALALLTEAASPDFRNLYNPASPAMENGKFYLPTGASGSNPSWCCLKVYVPYAMDDRYGPNTLSFSTGGDTIINYYAEDGTLISAARYTSAGRELLTLPQNTSYIIVSTAISNKGTICLIRADAIVTNYIAYSSASMRIPFPTLDEYYQLLNHLDDYFKFSGNLINPTDASEWIAGSFFYGNDGTNGHYYYATAPNKNGVSETATWSRTNLIPVKPNTTYYFGSNQAQIVEYNDRFISVTGHVLAAANAPHSLTTTATTRYIGYSCPTASRSSAYITTDANFTGGSRKIRPNGELVLGKTDLDKLLSIYLMQPDELGDSDILGSGKTNNLFKANRVFLPGFFIYYATFEMRTADNYIQSLLIPVEGGQQYDASVNISQGVWLDVYRNFISGFTGNATVTAPANAYYCSLTFRIDYTSTIDFRKHGSVDPDTSSIKYIKDSVRIGTLPELSLPAVMYATVGEEFSIYFRNVTKYSNNVYEAYEYRIAKYQNGSWAGIGGTDQEMVWYPYKIGYTPASEKTEQFRLQIYDTYNSAVISEKIFTIISVNTSHIVNTSPTIVTIGDSFTDGYGVSANLYTFLTANGFTPNMIGKNTTDLSVRVSDGVYTGPMDDAWSGWGYINVYGSRVGYLRPDRVLSDDEWDSGWGENETYGWTTGQTYSDLSDEQKSHGRTNNQFYNPATQKFDFSYYMNKYYPSGTHVDYFVSFLGLNDVINSDGYKNGSTFETLMNQVKHIVTSVHAYDSSIKIILGLVTPQREDDNFCYLYRGLSEKHCKINQEVWNAMMLAEFDGKEAQNIYVMPTHANFDTRFSIRQITKQPCKYKADYTESISYDIHPNAIGSKYIADTARNVILKLSS